MNAARYKAMQDRVELIGRLVLATDPAELAEFIEAGEHADTVAPFLDPTAWMAGHDRLRTVIDHARALARYRRALAPEEVRT